MLTFTEKLVRAEFRKSLEEVFRRHPKLTVTEAARNLGISRQALHKYLKEEMTPRGDVLMTASRLWGLTISVNGMKLTREKREMPEAPQQLSFQDFAESLDRRDISVLEIRKPIGSERIEVVLCISATRR